MLSLNDAENWYYPDPWPEVELKDIPAVSDRATSLIARSKSPLLNSNFVQLAGLISILNGLDYHHGNYCRLVSQLVPVNAGSNDVRALRHEAIAWLNRMGQFHAFTTSKLGKNTSSATPCMDSLLVFRHKHAAHRSIDAPRREDSAEAMIAQAMSMSDLGGQLWLPRPDFRWPADDAPDDAWATSPATHFLGFQMATQSAGVQIQDLVVERDHQPVMLEAFTFLERLLAGI